MTKLKPETKMFSWPKETAIKRIQMCCSMLYVHGFLSDAELGDHAVTHIVPRLKKVIDGEDPGGVTESLGWQGGGGFRFFKLAPSLLHKTI